MSPAVEKTRTIGTRRALRRTPGMIPADGVDLAPLSARQAVGRMSGITAPVERRSFWRAAGIVGGVSLVAAASAPLMAGLLLSG
ncbi:hypothetical protein ACTJKK_11380 [Microbacterium sp. 22179]|uniref:hypothetical protein n=1 Tax=Microbacterium sp. 22179 TaxID=3453886 RepID=UPI003F832A6A|nr:hypothetical protein [Microbacterium sp.]